MNLITVFNFIKEKKGYPIPFKYKIIYNLPLSKDELMVKGDVFLQYIDKELILPDNLTINCNLDLRFSKINKLPENLTVTGILSISYTKITELPKTLTVLNSLELKYTQISKLSDNLKLKNYLSIDKCSNLKQLPDNLTVSGLWMYDTVIREIPNNLNVSDVIAVKDSWLANNYSDRQIKELILQKGGTPPKTIIR